MAHEGYYSEASSLGSVNDLLNEAELYKDQANASAISAAASAAAADATEASVASYVAAANDAAAAANESAVIASNNAINAANSATNSATSATESSNSAVNSASSATSASASALAASGSAVDADASETNAAASASAAAASAASIDPASLLTKAGNLSGLADKAVSRENLGIFNFAKNKIINGDCRVAQRPSTAIINSSIQYGQCDRYFANLSATTVTQGSIVQATASPSLSKSGFVVGVAGATTTGTTSGGLGQRIEAANTKDLSGATVTISCKVHHDFVASTNWYIQVAKANSLDNFSEITTIQTSSNTAVPANTPTTLTFTFTLSAADVLNGLQVFIGFFGAAAFSNNGFFLSELQLEVGSVATPFEHRPIGQELALCQRYFEVINGIVIQTLGVYKNFYFKVTKRAVPTLSNIIFYDGTGATFIVEVDNMYQDGLHNATTSFSAFASAEL